MKTLVAFFGGLGILGICALVFLPLIASIYGLILAFHASIILGVLVLLVEPSPLILGALAFFGHPEVAQKIAAWMGLA